jgi:feruloyl esterase
MAKVDPLVKAKCDVSDGVKDGLIQNPAACDFRPDRNLPRCVTNVAADNCFTKAQIESISAIVTAVTDEHGKIVQPGYSISELQDSLRMPPPTDPLAVEPWTTDGLPPLAMYALSDGVLRVFVHKNDPKFHARQQITFTDGGNGTITAFHAVVPEGEITFGKAAVHLGIGGDPAAIAPFFNQGGKLLLWANLSDQLLTPYMAINYYKELSRIHGGYAKLQDVARLFLIPGTAHCSISGCGPDNFDALTAIEQWVEQGSAPDSLLATQYARKSSNPKSMAPAAVDYTKAPLRTMPLCKFPEMAHYAGHGDVNDATNWACPQKDTSMLKIGESGRQAGIAR